MYVLAYDSDDEITMKKLSSWDDVVKEKADLTCRYNVVRISQWEMVTNSLPKTREGRNGGNVVWFDGDQILCDDKRVYDSLMDVFSFVLNDGDIICGQYEEDEDVRNDEVDEYTGLYYITID